MKFKNILVPAVVSAFIFSGCAIVEDFQQKVGLNQKSKTATSAIADEKTEEKPVVQPQQVTAKTVTQKKEETKIEDKKISQTKHKRIKPTENSKKKGVTAKAKTEKSGTKKGGSNMEITNVTYEKFNGEWSIMSVFGENIIADEHPMIYFEASSHRFYGNNGCNTVNGNFSLGADKNIILSDIATTMMMCPDAEFEFQINKALNEVASYSFSVQGEDSYLTLKSQKGVAIMTLHRSDNAFINGAWQVVSVNGNRMAVNDDMRLVIDTEEGRIHGTTGCNMVNGTVIVDAEQKSSIQFTSLISTRMSCPDQSLETALLLALENVASWGKDGNNHVILYDSKKNEVAKLRKLSLKEIQE